jgi:hypothetical protein
MSFASPIWLLGLAALAVPVIIHLLNRRQSRVIFFGSLRHLSAYNTRQSLHLRVNEIALLLLRCAIVTLLILLLARLQFRNPTSDGERWIVVESGLQSEPGFSVLIDSLKSEGYIMKFLAPNFPDEPDETSAAYDYWELAQALDESSASHVVVLSYGYAERFWGKRSPRPTQVTWLTKQPSPTVFALEAVAITADSAIAREGSTSGDGTTFSDKRFFARQGIAKTNNGEVPLTTPDTIRITVVSDTAFDFDRKVVIAAIRAVDESIPSVAMIIQQQPDQKAFGTSPDWIIWLSRRDFINQHASNCIVYHENIKENRALTRVPTAGKHEYWILNKRLGESVLLEENLMLQLAQVLGPSENLNRLAALHDRRALPEEMMWATTEAPKTASAIPATDQTTPAVLTLLLLATLVAERLLAIRRNQ